MFGVLWFVRGGAMEYYEKDTGDYSRRFLHTFVGRGLIIAIILVGLILVFVMFWPEFEQSEWEDIEIYSIPQS